MDGYSMFLLALAAFINYWSHTFVHELGHCVALLLTFLATQKTGWFISIGQAKITPNPMDAILLFDGYTDSELYTRLSANALNHKCAIRFNAAFGELFEIGFPIVISLIVFGKTQDLGVAVSISICNILFSFADLAVQLFAFNSSSANRQSDMSVFIRPETFDYPRIRVKRTKLQSAFQWGICIVAAITTPFTYIVATWVQTIVYH